MRLQAKGRACAKALGRRQQARFKEPKGAASGGGVGMGPARRTKACQSDGGPCCGQTNGEQLGALQQWFSCLLWGAALEQGLEIGRPLGVGSVCATGWPSCGPRSCPESPFSSEQPP